MPPAQPTTHSSNDAQTWVMFLFLAAIWGSSFLFIKVGLDEGVAPMTIVSLRTFFASLLLGGVLLARGGRLPLQWDVWKRMVFLGVSNIVVPFALIAWGQQYIPSGLASILNAMVPLFTAVLAAVALADEHITVARLAGLGIGFGGVVLLALPSLELAQADADAALAVAGMVAVVLAAIFYAIASVYTRRRLTGHAIIRRPDGSARAPSPAEISFGSAFSAFVIITVMAVLFERPEGGLYAIPASSLAWLAMIWLGALGTGVAYLLFFRLIERWGATRTTLVTYVIPVLAIALGFAVLGERLRPLELAGAVLILGGVVLVNANVGQRPLFRRAKAGVSAD
ncbi:MAG TPA: DMT family transporter [Anaerolineae bacterium]|nr:DMT family transporter [Anaerolineae bacterium]